jgi:hypothetical protein
VSIGRPSPNTTDPTPFYYHYGQTLGKTNCRGRRGVWLGLLFGGPGGDLRPLGPCARAFGRWRTERKTPATPANTFGAPFVPNQSARLQGLIGPGGGAGGRGGRGGGGLGLGGLVG